MIKHMLSLLLVLAITLSMTGIAALAEDGTPFNDTTELIDCHPPHDSDCGYIAPTEGQPCAFSHAVGYI